jgi:hypothetical protein
MKGQYRVIMEVLLFGIGVAITSFILINFANLQKNTSIVSTEDQMETVLNSITNGIVKASQMPNSIIRIEIPKSVSGKTYKLFIQNKNNIVAVDLEDTSINVSRKLFNLNESLLIKGEVVSSAGIVEIKNDGSTMIMQRG